MVTLPFLTCSIYISQISADMCHSYINTNNQNKHITKNTSSSYANVENREGLH